MPVVRRRDGSPPRIFVPRTAGRGCGFVNWAIFEPPKDASPLVAGEDEPIDPEDPDFRAALELLGLRVG